MNTDNSYCQEQYYLERSNDRHGHVIDMLIMHTTESSSFQSTASTFMHQKNPPVTAHYVIDRDGKIYRFCPEERAANHAGKGSWRLATGEEIRNLNQRSIGIEFQCGPGEEITPQQVAAGLWLTKDIMRRNPHIRPENVVGHSDVAGTRKTDPGLSFPWELWVENGLAANPTRRGNDGRSSTMSPEMRLAYQQGYFNVNNYAFEGSTHNTLGTSQGQLAQAEAQYQNQALQEAQNNQSSSESIGSSLVGMLLTAVLSKITGNSAISNTLASAAMKSITDEPSQSKETAIASTQDNKNNSLG